MTIQKDDAQEIGCRAGTANSAPAVPDFLRRLLAAREERAFVQQQMLSSARGGCLVQIAVNVPGYPKRIENDAEAVQTAEIFFLRETAARATIRTALVNPAGVALLLLFPRLDGVTAKTNAIDVEHARPWGRALDIDVITRDGNLSRRDVSLPPRRCVLCENEAKICARERHHDIGELRDAVRRMLAGAAEESCVMSR